jgi:hypothetical protein
LKDLLRSFVGKMVHVHLSRSNESLYGKLQEVSDEVAVLVSGDSSFPDRTFYVSLSQIVWFEMVDSPEAGPPFRSEFH